MKKIAVFVEGQTEQIFVCRLFVEIAGYKNISILLKKFKGREQPSETVAPPQEISQDSSPRHEVLIYNCGGDESVKSRILEEKDGLFRNNYLEIVGIRDLYPLLDFQKLYDRLHHGLVRSGIRIEPELPANTRIIIAVHEIESWFLSEVEHFVHIDERLTKALIEENIVNLGFNPYLDDIILRLKPSEDLRNIYKIAGKTYSKKRNSVERTVECLDYASIYIGLSQSIRQLGELISKIDAFLD